MWHCYDSVPVQQLSYTTLYAMKTIAPYSFWLFHFAQEMYAHMAKHRELFADLLEALGHEKA